MASIASLEFDGGNGDDTAQLLGTNADGQVILAPFAAAITEGLLYASVDDVEVIVVDAAGGADHVLFEGRTGADAVTLYPTSGVFEDKNQTDYKIRPKMSESNDVRGGFGATGYLRLPGDETFTAFLPCGVRRPGYP